MKQDVIDATELTTSRGRRFCCEIAVFHLEGWGAETFPARPRNTDWFHVLLYGACLFSFFRFAWYAPVSSTSRITFTFFGNHRPRVTPKLWTKAIQKRLPLSSFWLIMADSIVEESRLNRSTKERRVRNCLGIKEWTCLGETRNCGCGSGSSESDPFSVERNWKLNNPTSSNST